MTPPSPLTRTQTHEPDGRPRARGLGIPLPGTPGPWNAITDVSGLAVGYTTLVQGSGSLEVGQGPVRARGARDAKTLPRASLCARTVSSAASSTRSSKGRFSGAARRLVDMAAR